MASIRNEKIKADDGGTFDGHLALPASGAGPGLLLLHEIFGVARYVRERADKLAGLGYVVLAPDLWWRVEPNIVIEPGPENLQRALDIRMNKLDYEQSVRDADAAFRHLRQLPELKDKAGVIGFCYGGGIPVRVPADQNP